MKYEIIIELKIKETTLQELMSLDKAIEKAEQKIEYLSSDEDSMRIYYERERSLHERANMISTAEARGREKGLEQGKIQVAINLLNMNIPMEQIVLATGLTMEELNILKDKI